MRKKKHKKKQKKVGDQRHSRTWSIIKYFKKNPWNILILIVTILGLIANIYFDVMSLPLKNTGELRSPFYSHSGEGRIIFGNSKISINNGGGLVVIDDQTDKVILKIERALESYFFFKMDKLLVSVDVWDFKGNQIMKMLRDVVPFFR